MCLWCYRESQSKIGDLMKTNAPFLKMYSEYVKNFDHAMELINTWMDKSAKFANLIKDIQVTKNFKKNFYALHVV